MSRAYRTSTKILKLFIFSHFEPLQHRNETRSQQSLHYTKKVLVSTKVCMIFNYIYKKYFYYKNSIR